MTGVRVVAVAVFTVLLLGVSGCGGGSDSRPDPATLRPVLVSDSLRFSAIDASQWHTCAAALDGSTWCWGKNAYGELGTNEPLDLCDIPGIELVACTGTPRRVAGAPSFAAFATSLGASRTCGVSTADEAWCWGFGLGGQLGTGILANSVAPMKVAGDHRFTLLRASTSGLASCGITAEGEGWCWGPNDQWGIFGSGSTVGSATPIRVDWGRRFVALDLGELHGCGIDVDGRAWCWGSNWFGQLGVGSAGGSGGLMAALTPVAVAGDRAFRYIAAGSDHSCALDASGAAWCWGAAHAIGSVTTIPDYVGSPRLVDGGHVFTALASGALHTCGLTAGGEVWCWGQNYLGELGDGTPSPAQVPVKLQSDVRFDHLAHRATCALGTDGRAWCWGDNSYGQVGRPSVYAR